MFTNLAIIWGPNIVGMGDVKHERHERLLGTKLVPSLLICAHLIHYCNDSPVLLGKSCEPITNLKMLCVFHTHFFMEIGKGDISVADTYAACRNVTGYIATKKNTTHNLPCPILYI